MTLRIEILAFDKSQVLDITGPLQVFATANDLARIRGVPAPYEILVVAREQPVSTSSGMQIVTLPLPDPNEALHTLIVSGGYGVNQAMGDADLITWIRARSRRARRTASVCSGAFLLATAGLLKGRRAATHWQRAAEFAACFPEVRLETDPIFIRDGSIWTSAGITAGIDLALALVEDDLGHETALAIARQLVVFMKRPGGQAQFSAALRLQDAGGRFDVLHAWIVENLNRPLSLAVLAERMAMSERSFSRHYRQATGRTPARAVEDLRFETARRLLEQGVSVARVAASCGFGAEETMRRVFLRQIRVSPKAYRERFSE
ncbi:GlxA family transcriptional regulator [Rhizobium straminoryzae]|uniref:Helix-turn-helix domain-containing protein n=1 Tax=Rhizobium straminoryzae TaxID=1387186 RepID=A0A549T874_9HYPH|nr:helix-turn-helix domain-containing protein [Rhizobium straminoryzae]TRL38079.1 helix-turn-helix domain-containing protein [Rhizobium straminoryzae]